MVSMKKMFLLLAALLALTGCSSVVNTDTSYFNDFTAEETDGGYHVSGTAFVKGDENAVVAWVSAETAATVSVTGTLECPGVGVELLYISEDGSRSVLAEKDDAVVDAALDLPPGNSVVRFSGADASCDFDLEFHGADGVVFSGEKPE